MMYFDNSATTRPFDSVIDGMSASMRDGFYNASAAYRPAMDIEKQIHACRQAIIAQTGAKREDEVIFTAGGTESDNLAILGAAAAIRRAGVFLVSSIEHPAVAETMRRVEKMGHEVRIMPINARGVIDLEACERLMDEDTAFISCMQVSNETGAIQPVAELSAMARAKNRSVLVHVDGVQGFMRVPMNMSRMGVDLYALSGHKIHGPKGVGALVVRKGVRLIPQTTGGGQEKGIRSGTYNSPAIIGLHKAIEEMAARQADVEAMRALKLRLYERVSRLDGVKVNGPEPAAADSAPHILSLSFDGVRGEVMRNALEGEGILVSTGSACSSHKQKVSASLRSMGLSETQADGTIRISFGLMNNEQEIDTAAEKMEKLYALLKQYRRR
ncbi:MAG: cysteine desulfurase [Clostridia bacterium]|nr:cysteine desulfurase [Clostridia bacterium]